MPDRKGQIVAVMPERKIANNGYPLPSEELVKQRFEGTSIVVPTTF